MTNKKISIDTYRCNGCGTCVEICPEIFRLNSESEKAEALAEAAELTEELARAAAMCPTGCIELD